MHKKLHTSARCARNRCCVYTCIGVEFWFCMGGGSYLVTLRGVRGDAPRKIFKIRGVEYPQLYNT